MNAARRYLESIRDCPDKVIVKLDFKNAFNCIRRDRMLEAVALMAPEIYAFCHNAYACHPLIRFNNSVIESATVCNKAYSKGTLSNLYSLASRYIPCLLGPQAS